VGNELRRRGAVSGFARTVTGVRSSVPAVVATTLVVLTPDAIGGSGPVGQPLFGMDLLNGSTVGQLGALAILLASVWLLAETGIVGHRASAVAVAVSALMAQPLLDVINEPVAVPPTRMEFLNGWPSGVAIAVSYSVITVGLLASVEAIRSAMWWCAHTITSAVRILIALVARVDPTSVPLRLFALVTSPVVDPTRVRSVNRRGPPRLRPRH